MYAVLAGGDSIVPLSELWGAAFGGTLIALSSSFYLYQMGRISGISGILEGGFLNLVKADWRDKDAIRWKLTYSAGLMLSVHIYALFATLPPMLEGKKGYMDWTWKVMLVEAISGFLVGLGSRLSNGCTSGHGVCGLSRLSLRSFTAVMTFMFTAVITASMVVGESGTFIDSTVTDKGRSTVCTNATNGECEPPMIVLGRALTFLLLCGSLVLGIVSVPSKSIMEEATDYLITTFAAVMFGLGLLFSKMAARWKVLAFLNLSTLQRWDPSLMLVLCAAVGINLITFNYIIPRMKKPLVCNTMIDRNLVVGAALFGIGWGLSGTCPGPMMLLVSAGYLRPTLIFAPALLLGMTAVPRAKRFLAPQTSNKAA